MKEPFIHPTSLADTQHIGQSTRVWAFTQIMQGAHIGSNCNIGSHCFIESGATVGNDVTIKNGSMIWEGVTLEDGVFVGPNVLFTNDRHPRSPRLAQARKRYSTRAWLSPTLVRRGASIGAGATIIAGITIGEFALVGAGAVVAQTWINQTNGGRFAFETFTQEVYPWEAPCLDTGCQLNIGHNNSVE